MTKNNDSSGSVKKSDSSDLGGLYTNTELFEPTLIITHASKAHLDDFLSVALMLYRFPSVTEVRRVVTVEPYWLTSDRVIVLDIGRIYDQRFNNFDHHQISGTICTFDLLLATFYPKLQHLIDKMYKWVPHLGMMDTQGPISALGRLSSENKAEKLLRIFGKIPSINNLILSVFSDVSILRKGDGMFELLREIGHKFIGSPILRSERMELFKSDGILCRVKSPKDKSTINVFVFDNDIPNPSFGLNEFVKECNVFIDATVTKDPRHGGYCFYRCQEGTLDFSKVIHPQVMFKHASGFLLTTKTCGHDLIPEIIEEALL